MSLKSAISGSTPSIATQPLSSVRRQAWTGNLPKHQRPPGVLLPFQRRISTAKFF
ncbi:unnamed protein product [Nezara viridula]|uniref:Uncharacterized protein n=1 Tax=Nezara viridula TaxID=85310 RepID=A0A9P0HCZ3_NEZVI|nr:unnamed protein product [Nezara viridula]